MLNGIEFENFQANYRLFSDWDDACVVFEPDSTLTFSQNCSHFSSLHPNDYYFIMGHIPSEVNMRPLNYDFSDQRVASLADVIQMIATHDAVPATRLDSLRSSLSKLASWTGQDPTMIPFVAPVIEALIGSVRPDVVGISAKRLQNARSDIRFVLDLLGGSSRYLAPFSPEVQRLWDLLEGKYDRCSLSRLFGTCPPRASIPRASMTRSRRTFLKRSVVRAGFGSNQKHSIKLQSGSGTEQSGDIRRGRR